SRLDLGLCDAVSDLKFRSDLVFRLNSDLQKYLLGLNYTEH
ncbi:3327_t:CDS:1, partial [Gigaspora rosea]